MHASVLQWVGLVVEANGLNERDRYVLEVGSRNINGSVRDCFDDVALYHGIDMVDGPGVDEVCKITEYPRNDRFSVVVCTEMLEHDPQPWESLARMGELLEKDGLLILTTRGPGFPYHEYPGDYYRYTNDSLRFLIDEYAQLEMLELVPDPDPQSPGWFALAAKTHGRD